jgi:hypothetical protein
MRPLNVAVGQRFGMLVVVEMAPGRAGKGRRFVCRCDCGGESMPSAHGLVSGHARSCGCTRGRKPRHGHARRGRETRTYQAWQNMIARCEKPQNRAYARYGGVGVRVCAEWHTFDVFVRDMGECPEGLTLDRVDGSMGYEPGNCRWATTKEQNRNMKSNRPVEAFGETRSMAEWAEARGLGYQCLYNRIATYGWPPEVALSLPVRVSRVRLAALLGKG